MSFTDNWFYHVYEIYNGSEFFLGLFCIIPLTVKSRVLWKQIHLSSLRCEIHETLTKNVKYRNVSNAWGHDNLSNSEPIFINLVSIDDELNSSGQVRRWCISDQWSLSYSQKNFWPFFRGHDNLSNSDPFFINLVSINEELNSWGQVRRWTTLTYWSASYSQKNFFQIP